MRSAHLKPSKERSSKMIRSAGSRVPRTHLSKRISTQWICTGIVLKFDSLWTQAHIFLTHCMVHALELWQNGTVHLDLLGEQVKQRHHLSSWPTIVIHFHHETAIHKSRLVRLEGQLRAIHLRSIILSLGIGSSHVEFKDFKTVVLLAKEVHEVELIQPLGVSSRKVRSTTLGPIQRRPWL